MRLVLAALSRPITVVVALISIALCAVLALKRMPVDIFPKGGDPAIYVPQPYGGSQRTIVVTLDPDKLRQYRISPDEAVTAVSKGTLVMPSGTMWTGTTNRIARTNAALGGNLAELLSTPIRPVSGTTVYLRDIGSIESSSDIITAYAHVNGKRTVYIPVTKRSDASTLAVINAVKEALPKFKSAVPEDVDVRLELYMSTTVTNSIRNLVTDGQ